MIDLLIAFGIPAAFVALLIYIRCDLDRLFQVTFEHPETGPAQRPRPRPLPRHEAETPQRGTGRASTTDEAA